MKKNYIQPVSIVVSLKLNQQLLTVSTEGGNVKSVGAGGNYSGDASGVLGRGNDGDDW